MAWTVPTAGADFSVSEVVTAAKMNSHITDNLRYLKGLDGALTLEGMVLVAPASGVNLFQVKNSGVTQYSQFQFLDHTGGAKMFLGYIGATAGFGARNDTVEIGSVGVPIVFFPNNADAGRITTAGNFGFGTAAPQGRIHAVSAGGGFMFLSANAVDGTLQTLAVAGTVTQFATFWAIDRNNTGGGLVPASGNSINLGGSFGLVNTDTVTVAVTGGGAITVQRTAGSSGTHQVLLLVLYK
jgi:hypothetical protein